MVWTLLSEAPLTDPLSERWRVTELPPTAGIINYGFRVLVPGPVPQDWNTAGFFGVGQTIQGRLVVSRTHHIPLIFPGTGQALRILGPQEIDLSAAPSDMLSLVWSVHRWIPWEKMELYGLF